MLTKNQKICMFLCFIGAMLLAIVTFIPFRTLPFLGDTETTILVEVILKSIVFPILAILLALYPNILKYRILRDHDNRSNVVNIMSYYPVITYLIGLIGFIIHTVIYSQYVLGNVMFGIIIALLIVYILILIISMANATKILTRFYVLETILLDSAIGIMIICFSIVAWSINKGYYNSFNMYNDYFNTGDPILFISYILMAIFAFVTIKLMIKTLKQDEQLIYVNINNNFETKKDAKNYQYDSAYNDLLDDFEQYYRQEGDSEEFKYDVVDNTEEMSVEPTEELPVEPTEELPVEPTEETHMAEDELEESELIKEENPVELDSKEKE